MENWLEIKSKETNRFIFLGDFNRSFWHEQHDANPIRTDNSDPTGPLPSASKVRNLIGEINDGSPDTSKLTLLREECRINSIAEAACKLVENPNSKEELAEATKLLAGIENMGCRYSVGLDHILVGMGFSAQAEAEKISIGKLGRTLPANATHPNPLLALSDHCPLITTLHY